MIYEEQPDDFNADIKVVSCLVEFEGKILLLHRHNDKSQGGKWGIPAGKVDKEDKDNKFAIIRELREETGLIVNEDALVFHKTFYVVYPDKKYLYHYHNLKLKNSVNIIIENKEHQDYIWVTPQEALGMQLVTDEDYCLKDFYGIK
jgi:8-oxo-dGTP diphosphatase